MAPAFEGAVVDAVEAMVEPEPAGGDTIAKAFCAAKGCPAGTLRWLDELDEADITTDEATDAGFEVRELAVLLKDEVV